MPTQTEAQQKAAKGCLGCVGLVVLLVVGVVVISHLGYTSEDKAENDVKVSIMMADAPPATKRNRIRHEFETAPLKGGVAVLAQDLVAYWWKDGVVYYANGHAMAWSPTARRAPVGIGFSEIKEAVENR